MTQWRAIWTESRGSDHPLDFGLSIRWARQAKDLNPTDIYGLLGVPQGTLNNWENGQLPPPEQAARIIPLLAEHLDLDADTLWWNYQQGWQSTRPGQSHRRRLQWAEDYRQFPRGESRKRLAELWGVSSKTAGGRIQLLIKHGYLNPTESRKWEVCRRGHPLTEENKLPASGHCRRCSLRYHRAYRTKKRGGHAGDPRYIAGVIIEIFGEKKNILQWSKDHRCCMAYRTFRARLERGWDPVRALTEPSGRKS